MHSCGQSVILFSKENNQEKGSKMNDNITIYITSNYSVVLCDNDIEAIAASVRDILYSMPRPADYTVANIIAKAKMVANVYIERILEEETEENYCFSDLDNKQRTKKDYWQVIKNVLEKIEVITK